jgi:hypothetical protein
MLPPGRWPTISTIHSTDRIRCATQRGLPLVSQSLEGEVSDGHASAKIIGLCGEQVSNWLHYLAVRPFEVTPPECA